MGFSGLALSSKPFKKWNDIRVLECVSFPKQPKHVTIVSVKWVAWWLFIQMLGAFPHPALRHTADAILHKQWWFSLSQWKPFIVHLPENSIPWHVTKLVPTQS